jgi:AbiJ N-terminal domain 4
MDRFFKYPIDTLAVNSSDKVMKEIFSNFIRSWFFKAKWFEVYDLLEFIANFNIKNLIEASNIFLEREVSAYRFVGSQLTKITSEEEIKEIEDVLNNDDKFLNVKRHITKALEHMSDRKNPDYRNSIKESISAVEALCIIITGDQKATLGTALKIIEKNHNLHGSLKNAFSSFYGYTSDSSGIRHALTEDSTDISFDDAKFFLVSCSAFVNYLISKLI